MLRLKALPEVLSQGLGGGVVGCSLLNREGSSLSSLDTGAVPTRPQVVGAIVANLWEAYREQAGSAPEIMIYHCAEGVVACKAVTEKLLLCVYGDLTLPVGMLKKKTELIASYLEPSLSQVAIE